MLARIAAPLLALAIGACGGGDEERPAEPAREPGRLVVEKSLAGGVLFIEGSVTQLRIAGEDGREVLDELRPVETHDTPLFDRRLPEGTYRLAAVERPCEGNCTLLDPPVEDTRCQLVVSVGAGRTTRVALVLRIAGDRPRSDCSVSAG
jgi:hypothetical protein